MVKFCASVAKLTNIKDQIVNSKDASHAKTPWFDSVHRHDVQFKWYFKHGSNSLDYSLLAFSLLQHYINCKPCLNSLFEGLTSGKLHRKSFEIEVEISLCIYACCNWRFFCRGSALLFLDDFLLYYLIFLNCTILFPHSFLSSKNDLVLYFIFWKMRCDSF